MMNNDLISREAALNATKMVYIECIFVDGKGYEEALLDATGVVLKKDIEALPAVDAVPVVRCKDCTCKSVWIRTEHRRYYCGISGMYPKSDNDFCSYGERKDSE